MVRRQKQARRAVMGSIVGAALAVLLMGCCWLMPDSRADASSHYRSRRGMPSRSQSRSHAHSHSNLHSRRGAGSSMVPDREYGYDDDNDNDNDNDNEEELELQQELELELGDTLWTPTTDWQASSSYSSSEEDAFVDVDDLTEHHRRRRSRTRSGPGRKRSKPSKTKRSRSRETMERAERLLRALEEDDEVPRVAATAASQSTRRRSKAKLKSKSKSKSKRRRKTKKAPSVVATADLSGSSNNSSNNSSSNNSRIRGVGPSPSRRSPAASATTASASAAASRSAVASTVAPSKLSSPQEHPDRTTWEVPSYSHKISTMMKKTQSNQPANNINNNSNLVHAPNAKKASAPATTATATARTTTSVPTASRVPPRSAPATKPSASRAAAPQASTGTGTTPWVRKFLAGRPRDRLLPLPRDYISDNFNLAQLPPIVERIGYEAMGDNAIPVAKALQQHRIAAAAAVAAESSNGSNTKPVSPTTKSTTSTSYPIYRRALRLILAEEGAASDADTDTDTEEDRIIPQHAIQTAAEALYLLLHARFVVSPRGLEAIRHVMALDNTVFGRCPRSTCHGTGLLPYGRSNDYTSDASGRSNAVGTTTTQQQQQQQQRDARCHRYCPCCGEVWVSWDSKTDGCAWGPSWCHLFLLAFGTQVYATELAEAAARRANANANPNANGVPAAATPSSYGVAPLVPPPSPLLSRAFLPRTQPRTGVVHAATTAPAAPAAPAPRGHGDESEATSSRPTPSVFGFRVHPATAFGRPWNEPLVPSSLRGGGGGAFYTNTNTGYYSSPSPYDYHHT